MPPQQTRSEAPRVLQSVDRAIRILEVLASQPEGLALGEMAQRLKMKPQTLQSLIRSLQAHDLVVQFERGGKYLLGPRLHDLSRLWLQQCDRAVLAHDVVAALAEETHEPILLSELRGGRLFALVQAEARQALTVSHHHLSTSPPHTMATGKVLLAHLPEAEREAALRGLDLRQRTPRTITEPALLRAELARVREQGYALCDEEAVVGIIAFAVPVRGSTGSVEAAIGLSMPKSRCDEAHGRRVLAALAAAAREIGRRWGAPAEGNGGNGEMEETVVPRP